MCVCVCVRVCMCILANFTVLSFCILFLKIQALQMNLKIIITVQWCHSVSNAMHGAVHEENTKGTSEDYIR